MPKLAATLLTALWTATLTGCPKPVLPPIEWGRALPLHLPPGQGAAPALRPLMAADAKGKRIVAGRHYVTLTLDRLRFHRVPSVPVGGHVVVGVRVAGLGPAKAEEVRWLPGFLQAQGPGGIVELDPPQRIGPVPYGGGTPVIRVDLVPIAPASVSTVEANLQGAGYLAGGALLPWSEAAKAHREAYARAVEVPGPKWSARLPIATLPGPGDKRALVAGHHVFVLRAPRDKRERFGGYLTLQRREVQWRRDGRAYESSPYVVLTLSRSLRSPVAAESVREALLDARRLALASPPHLDKALARIGLARSRAEDSPGLTGWERALWVALARLQRAEVQLQRARVAKRPAAEVNGLAREVELAAQRLLDPRGKLRALLKPAEVRDIEMQRREAKASP